MPIPDDLFATESKPSGSVSDRLPDDLFAKPREPQPVPEKYAKPIKSLQELGAHKKPEYPGYTFLPNGVTANEKTGEIWIPSLNKWAQPNPTAGLSLNAGDEKASEDEATSAFYLSQHFRPKSNLPILPSEPKPLTKQAPSSFMTMMLPSGIPGVATPVPIPRGSALEYGAAVANAPYQVGQSIYRGLAGGAAALSRGTRSDVVTDESGNVIQAPPGGMAKAEAFEKKAVDIGKAQTEAMQQLEPTRTGAKIANFVAKMPIELGKFAVEGPLAPLGMAVESAGNKYIDAKESGATDDQALAASGLEGAIAGVLGSIPGKESKTMTELILRKLGRGFVLGGGFHAGGAATTWIYNPEEAKKQLSDPTAWAKSITSMLAYEGASAIPNARAILAEERPSAAAPEPIERTPEQVRSEALEASRKGDWSRVTELNQELKSLVKEEAKPTPFREATPEEAGRVGEYEPLKLSPEDEVALQEVMAKRGETRVTEPTETQPEPERPPISAEDAEALKGLLERRRSNETALDEATSRAYRTKSKKANAEVERLTQEQNQIEDDIAKIQLGVKEEAKPTEITTEPEVTGEGLTPEGSGTGLLSNEEIMRAQRGDTYYRVDRSGNVTNLGPQPDAPVRNGEAILMVNGQTGKPQVQNSQGLGNDAAVLGRFGNKVMQVHERGRGMIADNLGLQQMYEAGMGKAKEVLGLAPEATDGDVVRAIGGKIGKLGSSVKETAIKIMNQIKGIGRDLAEAIADHLHKAFSGSREAQLGAVGKEVSAYTDEELAHYRDTRSNYEKMISEMFPGEENKAIRAEMYSNIPGKNQIISEFRGKAKTEKEPAKPATLKEVAADTHIGKVFSDVKRVFAIDVGEKGEQTKASMRTHLAEKRLEDAKGAEILKPLRNPFEKLPIERQHEIIDAYEAGEKLKGYGGWDSGSEWARKEYDNLWGQMKDAGIDNVGYLENYLSLMVKNKEAIPEYINRLEKSLAGKAGFLQTREIANYKTLRELGIEPEFTNLADIMTVSMSNMRRLIAAKRMLNDEVAAGRVIEVDPNNKPPEGYVQLDTNITSKIGNRTVNEKGEPGRKFDYYADPGTANVFNNHVSRGFEGIPNTRNLYRWARTTSDASVAAELALSGYHFMFGMRDAAISTMALGVSEMQQGNYAKGALDMIKGATPVWAQLDVFMKGRELQKALLSGEIPENLKQLAEDFVESGATATPSDYRISTLHNNARQQFQQAANSFGNKDYWRAMQQATGGLLKSPLQFAELVNKPLMEYMIPRMKIGVWAQLAAHERMKGPENLRERLQKAWQVTEDRLGQMTYDNLFWHQMARQMLHVGTRSVGWNLGTINVGLGGAKDIVKNIVEIPKKGLQPMSQRANYLTALLMYEAMTGMVVQYLSGQGKPKKLENTEDEFVPGMPYSTDMFAPRTGGSDRYGRPNRVMPAGYLKDMAEFVRISGGKASVKDYLASKLNPAISRGIEAVRNRDSMGNEIGSTWDRLLHTIPTPISFEQYKKEREKGKSVPAALAPSFGLPAAKQDLVSTSGENALRERINARRAAGEGEATEDITKINRFAEAIHAGNEDVVNEAVKKGEITEDQAKRARKMSRERGFFKANINNRNLTFNDLVHIFDESSPDERRLMRSQIASKFGTERRAASPSRLKTMESDKARMDRWYSRGK